VDSRDKPIKLKVSSRDSNDLEYNPIQLRLCKYNIGVLKKRIYLLKIDDVYSINFDDNIKASC
jgi:hypothetical protein